MNFFQFVIKDITNHKLRLFFTFSGVMVGIAACVIMMGISESIKSAFKNAYSKRKIDIVVYEKDNFDVVSSKVPASYASEIKKIPEVKDTGGMLLILEKYAKGFLFVFGWPNDSTHYSNIEILKGKKPQQGEYEAIIGNLLANRPDMKNNDKISVKGTELKITGIYNSENSFEKSAVIMPIDTFQKIYKNTEGYMTGINVMLKDEFRNEESIKRIAQEIENKLENVTAQNALVFVAEKTNQILMGEKLSLLIVIIIITAVILGLSNTMMTAVFEKRKLMGILIAIGWQKKDVFIVILMQSFFIMFLGGILGTIIGLTSINYLFKAMDLLMFTPVLDIYLIFKIMGFILLSAFASALFPAWLIIQLEPVEVIRSE